MLLLELHQQISFFLEVSCCNEDFDEWNLYHLPYFASNKQPFWFSIVITYNIIIHLLIQLRDSFSFIISSVCSHIFIRFPPNHVSIKFHVTFDGAIIWSSQKKKIHQKNHAIDHTLPTSFTHTLSIRSRNMKKIDHSKWPPEVIVLLTFSSLPNNLESSQPIYS